MFERRHESSVQKRLRFGGARGVLTGVVSAVVLAALVMVPAVGEAKVAVHAKRCGVVVRSFRCLPHSARMTAMLHATRADHGRHRLRLLAGRCMSAHCARRPARHSHSTAKAAAGTPDLLASGDVLIGGEYLTASNGQYKFVMQDDGNLVLYTGNLSRALWTSRTAGHPGSRAVMQVDGNFVVYDSSDRPLWYTGTA